MKNKIVKFAVKDNISFFIVNIFEKLLVFLYSIKLLHLKNFRINREHCAVALCKKNDIRNATSTCRHHYLLLLSNSENVAKLIVGIH